MKVETRKIYDVYICHSGRDRDFVKKLIDALQREGVTVFINDLLQPGEAFFEVISHAVSMAKVFMPVVTENMAKSEYCLNQVIEALRTAHDRSKTIIPVCFSYDDFQKLPSAVGMKLFQYQCYRVDDCEDASVAEAARRIALAINGEKEENNTYEKLSEYIKAKAYGPATKILCTFAKGKLDDIDFGLATRRNFVEIVSILEKINDFYDYDYGELGRQLAEEKSIITGAIEVILNRDPFKDADLFYSAVALKLIFLERGIYRACLDVRTRGDISKGIIPDLPVSSYEKRQKPYLEKYNEEINKENVKETYTGDELDLILSARNFIFGENFIQPERVEEKSGETEDDELLCSIASFMREGNKLFDIISEKQNAEEFLRCLLVSYERLKNYCEVVGEKEICAQCIDRILELKEKISSASCEEEPPEKINDGIKSLLGFTLPKSGKYDLFISHKTEDVDIAEDMYRFMKKNMKEAFFDKESLPKMSKSQYREAIMQALEGSDHFVAILSDLAYLESYWVKLEMGVFQSEIDEGRKQGSNFILVVTNNVHRQIMESNKKVLPLEFRRCEIMKVEDYKKNLMSYITKL